MAVLIALEWVPVESGLFAAAAYRASARQLYLRFCNGDIYRYFECPVSAYQDFLAAESKGRYFSSTFGTGFGMSWCTATPAAVRMRVWSDSLAVLLRLPRRVLRSATRPTQLACTNERAESTGSPIPAARKQDIPATGC